MGLPPTAAVSVIIAGNGFLRDALVFDRRLEHHAVGELVDHAALDLLPRRLARRIFEAAGLLQSRAALRQLFLRNQDVGGAGLEVYPDTVAGVQVHLVRLAYPAFLLVHLE